MLVTYKLPDFPAPPVLRPKPAGFPGSNSPGKPQARVAINPASSIGEKPGSSIFQSPIQGKPRGRISPHAAAFPWK